MKITVTLNGVKVERELPTSWEQVDFGTFIAIAECEGDVIKKISVMTGIDYDTLLKAQITNLEAVLHAVKFITEPLPPPQIPDTILGYKIPKDLNFQSLGQFKDIQSIITEKKPTKEAYPLYVATYAVNPYDFKEAEELAPAFMKAPCLEVLAVGNFTLVKWIELNRPTGITFRKRNSLANRFRLALANFRRNLGSLVRFYTWNVKQGISVRNS